MKGFMFSSMGFNPDILIVQGLYTTLLCNWWRIMEQLHGQWHDSTWSNKNVVENFYRASPSTF